MKILSVLSSYHRWVTILLAVLTVLCIGAADYPTGYRLSLGLLYVLPGFAVIWCVSRPTGTGIAILGAIAWFL